MSIGARCVFKVLTGPQWEALRRDARFEGSPADLADGFVHLSTAAQLAGTLVKHYAGQDGLMLLAVDPGLLSPEALRWEPARDGDLFPHLYDALPLAAVREAGPIERGPDGAHRPPEAVLAWA